VKSVTNLKIGTVSHYYPKIGVAVVDLVSTLNIGDKINFGGSTEYSQMVSSMQIEHEPIKAAKKGQTIGLKVDQPVHPGDEVSKAF
jgi:translation elongation factor EF-1alpha